MAERRPGNPTGKGGFAERKHHINKNGRPKNFYGLRLLAQQISHEVAMDGKTGKPININGYDMTVAEEILRNWARSSDAGLQRSFMEVAYGRPPNVTVIETDEEGKAIDRTPALIIPAVMDVEKWQELALTWKDIMTRAMTDQDDVKPP